jgi:integrase
LSILDNDFNWLMNREMQSIQPIDFEGWKTQEKAKNKAATVNRKMTVIKAALAWAKKNKLIRHNQIATLERLTEDDSNVSWRYLSSDERTRLIMALNGTTRQMYTIVLLAMNTGIRKNALLSLKWEDVNFKEKKECGGFVGLKKKITPSKVRGLKSRVCSFVKR